MSADSFDNHPYIPDSREPTPGQKRYYWAVALGLQATDGLSASAYAYELAKGYEEGIYTLAETGQMLREHHPTRTKGTESEADLVAQRIAELLAQGSFTLAPGMLAHIHAHLFQDFDEQLFRPGKYKEERLVKQEDILNGDSVLYADPAMVEMSLDFLFREQAREAYGARIDGEQLQRFCAFISNIWQVHPFIEGNTRTTAVFSELYLASLGVVDASNDQFAAYASFYRNALVRAQYRNAQAQVLPTLEPLVCFYDNLLNGAGHVLDEDALRVEELFAHPELLRNIPSEQALSTGTTK